MTALSVTAGLALAVQCAPGVDPNLLVGIARHESGLDPTTVHHNANGTTDHGLMQINSANFAWLGLTLQSAMDPCRSMAAGATVLRSLSAYNTGDGSRGIANGYALRVLSQVDGLAATARSTGPPPPPPWMLGHSPPAAPDRHPPPKASLLDRKPNHEDDDWHNTRNYHRSPWEDRETNATFRLVEDMYRKAIKLFNSQIEIWNTYKETDGIKLIALGTFCLDDSQVAVVQRLTLMNTTKYWMPFENMLELKLIDMLVANGRRFNRGLRYNLPSTKPIAAVFLCDTGATATATATYIIPANASQEYRVLLDEMIRHSGLNSWVWKEEEDMPPLPPQVNDVQPDPRPSWSPDPQSGYVPQKVEGTGSAEPPPNIPFHDATQASAQAVASNPGKQDPMQAPKETAREASGNADDELLDDDEISNY